MKKIFSIVGARPHFIKAAPLMQVLSDSDFELKTIHTGQHYDTNMSDIFFDQLKLPVPEINLEVGSGTHATQTSLVMTRIEEILISEKPDFVVVYGDTNSTLGATLAAAKLYIPIVHVEGGVRCENKKMPEEINRAIIDKLAFYNACPSELAVNNLRKEGICNSAHFVGDFMFDTFCLAREQIHKIDNPLKEYNIQPKNFILSTIHREESTKSYSRLESILNLFSNLEYPVILPLHPRTKRLLIANGYDFESNMNLKIIDPLGYLEIIYLLINSKLVITDSGGLTKESFWSSVPCITLMDVTTWPETVDLGWNILAGLNTQKIKKSISEFINTPPKTLSELKNPYGEKGSALRMAKDLNWL
jgi:UDP-N-acetylglucosamine 2-epimerase